MAMSYYRESAHARAVLDILRDPCSRYHENLSDNVLEVVSGQTLSADISDDLFDACHSLVVTGVDPSRTKNDMLTKHVQPGDFVALVKSNSETGSTDVWITAKELEALHVEHNETIIRTASAEKANDLLQFVDSGTLDCKLSAKFLNKLRVGTSNAPACDLVLCCADSVTLSPDMHVCVRPNTSSKLVNALCSHSHRYETFGGGQIPRPMTYAPNVEIKTMIANGILIMCYVATREINVGEHIVIDFDDMAVEQSVSSYAIQTAIAMQHDELQRYKKECALWKEKTFKAKRKCEDELTKMTNKLVRMQRDKDEYKMIAHAMSPPPMRW